MLVSGRLADRLGPRLVPAALVAFGAAAILPGLARGVAALFVFLTALGLASGLLDIAINTEASRVETDRNVRVLDGLHAAFSAGVVVGSVGAGLLRGAGAGHGWILTGVGVGIALVAAANRPPVRSAPRPSVTRARVGRPLALVGAVLAVAYLVENGLEVWSALFLERSLGSSPAISGLGPGVFAASMVAGRSVAQRFGRTSVPRRIAFAGVTAAAGLAAAAVAPHAAVALAGFGVAGAGLALSAPTLIGAAGRLGGSAGRGAAVSSVAILGYLGFVAGPPLFGAVAGAAGLRAGFVFLAAVAVLLAASAPLLAGSVRESRA